MKEQQRQRANENANPMQQPLSRNNFTKKLTNEPAQLGRKVVAATTAKGEDSYLGKENSWKIS